MSNAVVRRGEIYLVDFNPSIGSEIRKIRPALIIQNDIDNKHSPVTIVTAISSIKKDERYPTEVCIEKKYSGLDKDSIILLNQIRTVDKGRLIKKLSDLDPVSLRKVDQAIGLSLGLI